jgi:hypothetical protein
VNYLIPSRASSLPPTGLAVVVRAVGATDFKNRVVITGQGIASCFGNDVNTFYEK